MLAPLKSRWLLTATLVVWVLWGCDRSGLVLGAPVAPPPPATGWLLDEGTGTALASTFGPASTGQLGGPTSPTWSSDTPFAYPGNYSLQFAQSGSAAGNYARIDGHTSATKGTVSFWVADTYGGGPAYILDANDGHRTLMYRYPGTGNNFGTYLNQASLGAVGGTIIPYDGTWTHVALVWDNSLATDKQKIYKNGTLFFTSNVPISAKDPADVFLGSRFSGNETWGGRIDEYALWNTALSEANIQWLATHSLREVPMAKPPLPVSAWTFDEGAGSLAADTMGHNDGTLYSNVAWTTNTPRGYAGDHALWFDGTSDNRVNFGSHTFGTEGSIQIWAYRTPGAQYLFDASPGGRTLLYAQYALFMNDQYPPCQ